MERLKHHAHTALRKSEKYFKTDMVYLAKGGFWLGAGQIITSLSAFILAVASAHFLSKEVYGNYKYILSVIAILLSFSLPGMMAAAIQSVSKGKEGIIREGVKERIRWGFLGTIAAIGIAVYYFSHDNTTLGVIFLIASLFIPFFDTFTLYSSLLVGKRNFSTNTVYASINTIIASLLIILAMFFTSNVTLLILTYLVSWTLLRFYLYIKTLSIYKPNNILSEEALSYGKHLSIMNVLPVIAQYLDKILLFHYLGAGQLAVYAFATAIPEQIKSPFKNLQTVILPKFSEREAHEIQPHLKTKILRSGIFLGIITLCYIAGAPLFYKIFFPQYLSAVIYSQVFAISIIFISSVLPISFLQSQLAKKELYIYHTTKSIFQILIFAILIPFFGIWGAIAARLASDLFNFIFLTRITKIT